MNTAFSTSALFYDELYKTKNYTREARQLQKVIKSYIPLPHTMLDLGCGTCSHAIAFSLLGYHIVGIDRSLEMLRVAKRKLHSSHSIVLHQKDIARLPKIGAFDVVVSLFHVVSYQRSLQGVQRVFQAAYKNLAPGGLFIFDCWNGPGVTLNPPQHMVRTGGSFVLSFEREKTPILNSDRHLVQVTHETKLFKRGREFASYQEKHTLRYLFPKEVLALLRNCGFLFRQYNDNENNMKPPSKKSWSVLYVAQKPATPVV